MSDKHRDELTHALRCIVNSCDDLKRRGDRGILTIQAVAASINYIKGKAQAALIPEDKEMGKSEVEGGD